MTTPTDSPEKGSDMAESQDQRDLEAPAASPASSRTKLEVFLLMSALCMSVFLAALDMTIVTTALPTIAEHFGSSAGFVWVGSAFMLASATTTANWGKFSDVFGRKPMLLLASAVFFLGCALCGASTSLAMLIAGRAVQGAGAGGLLTLSNIVIGDMFSARERGKFYGMIGMVWATASSLGPVVGGALTSNVSWRWCFYINLPISGTAFVIVALVLKLPTPRTPLLAGLQAIDWLGSLSLAGGTLMLLMGLQFGGVAFAWSSPTVVCLVVFGLLVLVLFVAIEHFLAKFPVVPTHLYLSRQHRRSNLAVLVTCLFHGLTVTQQVYYLPLYFQAVLGASPLLSGVWLLPNALAVALCSASCGVYLKRTGRYHDPIVLGFVLAVLGNGLLYVLPRDRHSPSSASAWARIILFQIIGGAGIGCNFQPPLVALQSSVSPQDNAAATASFALVRTAAMALGIVTGSTSFANQMSHQRPAVLAAVGGNTSLADLLTGPAVQAHLFIVDSLEPPARAAAVRAILYTAMRSVWIQTVCFSAAGLLSCLLIERKVLATHHEAVQTGLAGEEERRRIALAERKGQN